MDHTYFQNEPPKNAPKRNTKRNTLFCSAPQCNNYFGPGISFHYFPKDPMKRKQWETALRMGKPASDFMRICSEHFLSTDYFPTDKVSVKSFSLLFTYFFYFVLIWNELRGSQPTEDPDRARFHQFIVIVLFQVNVKKRKLFPHIVPSQNLPKRAHDKEETPIQKRIKESRAKRIENRQHVKV